MKILYMSLRFHFTKTFLLPRCNFLYSWFCVFWKFAVAQPGGHILKFLKCPMKSRLEYIKWSKYELSGLNQSEITVKWKNLILGLFWGILGYLGYISGTGPPRTPKFALEGSPGMSEADPTWISEYVTFHYCTSCCHTSSIILNLNLKGKAVLFTVTKLSKNI